MREGLLTDEPVRGEGLRLLDKQVSENELSRCAARVIPTARRIVLLAFLTAGPYMMEPVNKVEIICPLEATGVENTLVSQRPELVVMEDDMPCTSFKRVMANKPLLDSFGF